ncbi:MAG: tRNA (adenosine(37)-N6)-dimethylallyltransferase MiaA [Chromatiales bacterium]|nr:tRNA (adenosine(37)-N6)-dimethylallyltransferase MiaA [Chromatiales bacterium]
METPVSTTVLCLSGPTATGKTALAIQLALRFPIGLVSVDSAMVYRGLDVGSGKPPESLRARVPHALVDIRDPWEVFSAGMFREEAIQSISAIAATGRLPLLVGGTMLYFRSLVRGLAGLPPADPELRAQIEAEAAQSGWPALHAELAQRDPAAAARIQPGDRQRIQRALEVLRLTGRPLSSLQIRPGAPGLHFVQVALVPADRHLLHRDIERRFGQMMAAGFLDEVAGLLAHPRVCPGSPALRAVGYRQLADHILGRCTLGDAEASAIVATRRLAKRQLTWLRGEQPDRVLDSQQPDTLDRLTAIVARTLGADANLGASR